MPGKDFASSEESVGRPEATGSSGRVLVAGQISHSGVIRNLSQKPVIERNREIGKR
jgi:hypothetical protein